MRSLNFAKIRYGSVANNFLFCCDCPAFGASVGRGAKIVAAIDAAAVALPVGALASAQRGRATGGRKEHTRAEDEPGGDLDKSRASQSVNIDQRALAPVKPQEGVILARNWR